MIKVKAIAFTGYPVTDIERARGFYEGVLGLKEARKWEHNDRAWIEYELDGAAIAVTNMAMEVWKPSPDGPSAALEVEDFDDAVASLKNAGVTFTVEPVDNGGCKLAVIADPDGNAIAIHKLKTA